MGQARFGSSALPASTCSASSSRLPPSTPREASARLELDDLKEILRLIEREGITEFELEKDGVRLRIKKASQPIAGDPGGDSAERGRRGAPCRSSRGADRCRPPRARGVWPHDREESYRGDVLSVARPEYGSFRGHRRPDQDRPGALHRRGDEADERDRGGGGRRDRRNPSSRTVNRSSTATPLFSLRPG